MKKILLFTIVLIITLGNIFFANITLKANSNSARVYEKRMFTLSGKGNADKFAQYQNKRPWSKFEPTGIYVKQNEFIKLTVNGGGIAKAYIQVPQNGNPWNANKQDLNKGINTIQSPINGVLYLANEDTTGEATITVEGGSHFPVFEKNAHTDQDFDFMIKKYPDAQYVEFVSDHALITVPRSDAVKYTNKPSELLTKIDMAIKSQFKLSAYDEFAKDIIHQQDMHYIHYTKSGYYSDAAALAFNYYTSFVNKYVETILNADYIHQYITWHETGHLVQQRAWNFINMEEVQVNLYERISRKELGENLSYDYTEIFDYLNNQSVTYDNILNPDYSSLKLGMLWQLYLGLGENFYPKLHQLVRVLPIAEQNLPLTEKKQLFMVMSCKASGRNLLPFFEKWRMEPTEKTRNKILKLNLPMLEKPIWESTDALPIKENVNIVVEFEKPKESQIPKSEAVKPNAPTNLSAKNITTNSITLNWNYQENIGYYEIYRNGILLTTTTVNNFIDNNLKDDTTYIYEVIAVSDKNLVSDKSNQLAVKTAKIAKEENKPPTQPKELMASNITTNSLDLTWSKSTHAAGIAKYIVYRNGVAIFETENNKYHDSALSANTTYTYTVKAVSNDNIFSAMSGALIATTKKEEVASDKPPEDNIKEWKIGDTFKAGDLITYNGKTYRVIVSHTNYGDPNWAPDIAGTLFSLVN